MDSVRREVIFEIGLSAEQLFLFCFVAIGKASLSARWGDWFHHIRQLFNALCKILVSFCAGRLLITSP